VITLLAGLGLVPTGMAADTDSAVNAAPVVNINQAGPAELAEALSGVGDKKANAIVRYREEHGDFISASGLAEVKGIGDATISKNQERIRLD
jgi:competence protein ComEA